MSATTIKLESALLKEIRAIKPREQTLAAYVREALERDVRRHRLALAAREYSAFLTANPDEQVEMEAWADAPLTKAPRRRKA